MHAACSLKSVWSSPTDHMSKDEMLCSSSTVSPWPFRTLPKVCHNLGSLSDTMDTGTPCTWIISRIYNWKNSSSVKVIHTARKCVDLVSQSTLTHTVSCLHCVCGKWVTKSIAICSYFHSATSNGWSSPTSF